MSKALKLSLSLSISLLIAFSNFASIAWADIFWSTPAKISQSSNHAVAPATITGPNGYLHTVWTEIAVGGDPYNIQPDIANPGVFYSYWDGDAWSTPIKISQNNGLAALPQIAVTQDNIIHVVWMDGSINPEGATLRILYSFSTDYGNSWSTPVSVASLLDPNPGALSSHPRLVSDQNNLYLTFTYQDASLESQSYAYYSKYNGTSWSTPERLQIKTNVESILDSAIAVDSDNLPHILLWEMGHGNTDPERGIYYTTFNGTSWSTPIRLSLDGEFPKIAIDSQNKRHAIWVVPYNDPGGVPKNRLEYLQGTGGTWSFTPTLISNQASYTNWGIPVMGVTFDSQNNVYVGWGERVGWPGAPDPAWKGVQVSYKKWNGSNWSDPVFMRLTYDLDNPFLYRDKWDNQHLAWSEENPATGQWEFWYSTVPTNVGAYSPASNFSLNIYNTLPTLEDTLTIPSNALATPATISAQIGPLPASANPNYTTIPRSYTFRPHGLQFAANKAATAVINYTDAEMIGADERNLKVYIWDSQTNAWSTSFDTSVNRTQNKATITLPHFSLYGVMMPNVNTTWTSPNLRFQKKYTAGQTIQVRFSLSYADVSLLFEADNRDDVSLSLLDPDGQVIKTYTLADLINNLRYDKFSKQFTANVKTKDLSVGTYKFQSRLSDNPVGEISFILQKSLSWGWGGGW